MNQHLQDTASVGARASILDVRQVVVSANLKRVTDSALHAEVDHTFDWRLDGTTLLCQAGCEVRITERESNDEVFDATVVYGCGFALSEIDGLEEAAYDDFARVNATLCLYPYIREAVQSLTSRAGLPPFVLGTFRAPITVGSPPSQSEPPPSGSTKGTKPRTPSKKAPSARQAGTGSKPKKSAGSQRGAASQ